MSDRFDTQLNFDGSAQLVINHSLVSIKETFGEGSAQLKIVYLTRDDIEHLDGNFHEMMSLIRHGAEVRTISADEVMRGDYLESLDQKVQTAATMGNQTRLSLGSNLTTVDIILPNDYPVTVHRRVM